MFNLKKGYILVIYNFVKNKLRFSKIEERLAVYVSSSSELDYKGWSIR